MNKLDLFDQLIKDSVSDYELPYDPSQWTKLQGKLGNSGGFFNGAVTAACLSGAVIITGLGIFGNTMSPDHERVAQVPVEATEPTHQIENVITIDQEEMPLSVDAVAHVSHESTSSDVVYDDVSAEPIKEREIPTTIDGKEVVLLVSDVEGSEEKVVKIKPVDQNTEPQIVEDVTTEDYSMLAAPEELPNVACVGEEIDFEAFTLGNVDVEWNFGDGKMSSALYPTHAYTKPGVYDITLTAISRDDNSKRVEAPTHQITVHAAPKAEFTVVPDAYAARPWVNFKTKGIKGHSYHWDLGNNKASNKLNPSVIYNDKGNYNVTLTVENEHGCATKTSHLVYIQNDYNLLTPNTLTNNGDGLNDTWFPEALKVLDFRFQLTVFDRSGSMVFKKQHVQEWDGTNQFTGEACQEGTYVWFVTLTNERGEVEEYGGHVILTR